MFNLPNLPKEIYQKLQDFRQEHGLTQWQAVIALVHIMCALGQQDPEKVKTLCQYTAEKYAR